MSVNTTAIQDYLWLEEVRSKVWNMKELEPELFRKVEVTQAHYTELQKRLNGLHSDRNLPEYNGACLNVRSVKLDVLRSILPENEVTSGFDVGGPGPEARSEGGFGINSLFPFTLKYLDLTTLALKYVPPRLPSPLFLRQEYDDISALIWDKPENTQSVIVSGQPGTGKTAYLYLRVIQFMIEGRRFLYQAKNGTVYHVNEMGVQAIKSWPSNENIVAFVDADSNNYEPDYMFLQDGVQIILAAPQSGASARWIKQANYDVNMIATKLWSRDELFIAGIFLYPFDISLKLLNESTSYFGYNPRPYFTSSLSVDKLYQVKMLISSWITSIGLKLSNMLQLKDSTRTDSGDFDLIVEISPINEDRCLAECGIDIVSRWAFNHFLKAYELQKGHAATISYRHIPLEMSLCSHVFGRQVLKCLGRIGAAGRDFPIRRLTSPGEMTWTCRGPIPRVNFLWESDFIDEITKAVQNNEPRHLVPSAPNFPAVDSILYGPNDVLTCIQTTVSSKHPINATGLEEFKAGAKLVHCLRISALQQIGRGASYLLYRRGMRRPSNCNSWNTIPEANGPERCTNMYWGWKYSDKKQNTRVMFRLGRFEPIQLHHVV